MPDFYTRTLSQLLDRKWLARDSSILVVCGGPNDREVFRRMGFERVVISNLDVRMQPGQFAPFGSSFQDVENLTYGDGEFDIVVAHQGLHHCYSAHRGLLEMFRVARRGVLAFEPRDTLFVRLGVRFDFGQEYEVAAVAANGFEYGGVKNTAIPNYVYRWTENEIEKTIHAYSPHGLSKFQYFYSLRVPEERLKAMKNRVASNVVQALLPPLRAIAGLTPALTNCFAFAIAKPELPRDLQPWMTWRDGEPVLNSAWVRQRYRNFDGA